MTTIKHYALLPDVDGWEKRCTIREHTQVISYNQSFGSDTLLVVRFYFYRGTTESFVVDVESRLEIDGDAVCNYDIRCRKNDVFESIFAKALEGLGCKFEKLVDRFGELQDLKGLLKGAVR